LNCECGGRCYRCFVLVWSSNNAQDIWS
jgi:hypothetical protein